MLTHYEVSGAAIFDDRTDRNAVVLVAEFFRSGIVFETRSYANIVRSIRRLFRCHTDWIAAGQFTRNGNTFIVWQIDVVVGAIFCVAVYLHTAGNTECIATKIYTAAITGCSVIGNFRRA